MSKTVSIEDHLLQVMGLQPGKFTIDDLVNGKQGSGALGFPASRIRKALGVLYGRGFARVDDVREGKEVWRLTTPDERLNT